jgi:alpha-1,3-rhamnosyl/mannosyltransferase
VDGRELARGVRTGIGRFLREVLRAGTDREGFEFILYGNGKTVIEPALRHVELKILPGKWTQWWDQVTLPRQLARDRVGVFLSPYYKCPLLAPCPVVLTIHDLFFIHYPDPERGRGRPVYEGLMTCLARLYASRAAAIIADSEHSKGSIVARLRVNPAKVSVIPVGLGAEFKPEPLTHAMRARYRITSPYILYVGNFKAHKNLPRLLRAYAGLDEALRGAFQFVLAGGDQDHQPALEGLARTLGMAERVKFPGQIDDWDLAALYSGAALVVLPSLEEGFGLPALEAMACGTPVVAANRAALPEVVGEAALLVDPEHEGEMTAGMARVLSSPEVRERLRQKGLARAREFSPDRTAARVLALLGEVGGRR